MTEVACVTRKVRLRGPKRFECSALVAGPIGRTEEELRQWLVDHEIDLDDWPADRVSELQGELARGEASVEKFKDGRVRRVVNQLILVLTKEGTGEILVESDET